jgi:hypothetical protein
MRSANANMKEMALVSNKEKYIKFHLSSCDIWPSLKSSAFQTALTSDSQKCPRGCRCQCHTYTKLRSMVDQYATRQNTHIPKRACLTAISPPVRSKSPLPDRQLGRSQGHWRARQTWVVSLVSGKKYRSTCLS